MTSLERMDETLRKLRLAGIKFAGGKLKVDYTSKRQTWEQARAEVARQKRRDKAREKSLMRLNEKMEAES